MMAGDAYSIPIKVSVNGTDADDTKFEDVEVCIGKIRKTLSGGDISYDESRAVFLFPITQEESFSLKGKEKINLRCKFAGGSVVGIDLGVIEVEPSLSREVL